MSRTRAEQAKALEEWADRVEAAELRQAHTIECVIEGPAVSEQAGDKQRLRQWEEDVK